MSLGGVISLVEWLALGVALVALALVLLIGRSFRRLTQATDQESLDKVLVELLGQLKASKKFQEELKSAVWEHRKEAETHIQKFGMVRFNPFADTGGDQSFTLALLDGQDNGFVISSLHSRDQTRIYAKPVEGGKGGGFELSREERRAIAEAKRQKTAPKGGKAINKK